ncbi:hypothetical protein PS918_02547 [Pseudomonas fluorescens]|uniref:Uncharacterized protein n=1 Tax=Pseudomonas fluorescens TaxID=294 RepID=A0A5E7SA30_PSEFL|nr:hypothetical protein [Pseudomonas fluorescens]VVP83532.1 hypothetical protein PS918_02547 [Pseudomonas fluorescens]
MALIDDVEAVCTRLATDNGWHALLLHHGLDIKARPLAAELNKTLSVDRTLEGFADFSSHGQRGIEAASPSRSLLYHALASPNVVTDPNGNPLRLFPSAAEIDRVLNYVYGLRLPSLADLQQEAGAGTPLAIVVFAAQYQPAPDTGHRKHADLCFSRTGIARVGTAPARYDVARRGFLPWVANDPKAICVTPARYYAYIAMQKTGDAPGFGPWPVQPGDENEPFWAPLHKLFSGPECLAGMNVQVDLVLNHINEKLRRFHLRFPASTIGQPDFSQPPFTLKNGLVEWADEQEYGEGLLSPVPRPRLVEEAVHEGQALFFSIPPNPQYNGYIINRRYRQAKDGSVEDLNLNPDVVQIVKDGGYNALHFSDFTAEGSILATCPQLAGMMNSVAAYSLVSAPDFYPELTQRSLLDWSDRQAFPQPFFGASLKVLSDRRVAGNPDLEGGHFPPGDKGIAAVVSHVLDDAAPCNMAGVGSARRHTWIGFGAGGFFSPGWDISGNGFNPTHLNSHELGCPFTEDIRICASIGGFWAAVSPDNSNAFEPTNDWISIIPLTDQERGSWDGTPSPTLIDLGKGNHVVEYQNYVFTDYTKNALAGLLSVHHLAQTADADYQARILTMHNAFRALGAITRLQKNGWSVLSFTKTLRPDAELDQAESATGMVLPAPVHRYRIYKSDINQTTTPAHDFTKRHVVVIEMVDLFVCPSASLVKREQSPWQAYFHVQP